MLTSKKSGSKTPKPAAKGVKKSTSKTVKFPTSANAKIAITVPKVRKALKDLKSREPVKNPEDELEFDIPGLMSESEVDSYVGELKPADKAAFLKLRTVLQWHFGSKTAARIWLVTPGRGFDGTPLDAVKKGMTVRVLEGFEAQKGPGSVYA